MQRRCCIQMRSVSNSLIVCLFCGVAVYLCYSDLWESKFFFFSFELKVSICFVVNCGNLICVLCCLMFSYMVTYYHSLTPLSLKLSDNCIAVVLLKMPSFYRDGNAFARPQLNTKFFVFFHFFCLVDFFFSNYSACYRQYNSFSFSL